MKVWSTVLTREQIYVDGAWRRSAGTELIEVREAATGQVIGVVPAGGEADVDAAVSAARAAFDGWSQTPLEVRLDLVAQLEKRLTERAEELATLVSREVGTPLKLSRAIQVGLPIRVLHAYADVMRELPLEERIGSSLVVREPIGVVGAITAWNYPLQQVVGKVGGALVSGCTVVLKPSEVAPLSAFLVADMLDELGLPPGVFNLVSGTGIGVGEALVAHPEVDMVHFTGSTRAGRRIGEVAARTVKRVALELGGKSANVILADADVERAVKVGVANCFINAGQTCTAWTRMLVPRDRLADVETLVRDRVAGYRLGDPLDPATTMGPLASDVQRTSVWAHIQRGIDAGATLLCGGTEPPEGTPGGFFVAPTVFSDVRPDMAIATEEIFGPVLSIMPYETDEEAIATANQSIYGLAGAVWSEDTAHAERVARRLRTGMVDINGAFFNHLAPFGGYKQSGIGRELGVHGLLEFFETKSMQHAESA